MLDSEGNALHRHRATIRKAVTLARLLIAIERDQTAGQLDMLDERLRIPHRSEDRQMSRTACPSRKISADFEVHGPDAAG